MMRGMTPYRRHGLRAERFVPACVMLVAMFPQRTVGQSRALRADEGGVATVTSNQPVAVEGDSVGVDGADAVVEAAVSKPVSPNAATVDPPAERTMISRKGRAARVPASTRRMAESLGGRDATPWYRTGLGSLTIVLVLVGGVAWVVRRWMPGSRIREDGLLRVVARASLTPKSNVALLRLGRRFVLLGVSGDRVSMLSEVVDPEEVAELALRLGPVPAASRSGFDRTLDAESRAYEHAEHEPDTDVSPPARRRTPKSASLQQLLAKIRTLQTGSRN